MRLSQPLLALSLATSACPRLGIRNERHETDSGFMVHFMEGLRIHENGRSSIFISFKFSFMKPACSQFISDPYPRYNVGFNGVKGLEFLVRQKVEKKKGGIRGRMKWHIGRSCCLARYWFSAPILDCHCCCS